MRPSLLFFAALCGAFASCSSIRDIDLRVVGNPQQNTSIKDRPGRVVYVRAYPLVGQASEVGFYQAPFGSLWVDDARPEIQGIKFGGDYVECDVLPPASIAESEAKASKVELKGVPGEVTHIGVLAMFRNCEPPHGRLVLTKDEAADGPVYIVVDKQDHKANSLQKHADLQQAEEKESQ